MPWVRLDDRFGDHPKFQRSGHLYPLLLALQVVALCESAKALADGALPRRRALALAALIAEGMTVKDDNGDPLDMTATLLVQAMVDAGLWDRAGTGYQIHDYHDYQPTRAQVQARRDGTKERVRRHRNGVTADVTADVTKGVTNARGNGNVPGTGTGNNLESGSPAQAQAQGGFMGFRQKKPTLTNEQEEAAALARRLNRAWIKAGMPRNDDGTPKMPTDAEIAEANE